MPTDTVMVEAKGLTKHYDRVVALDGLTLEVLRGEIVALVGPNGAGKTTALKLMAGLLSPTSGHVTIGGFDVSRQSIEAKQLISFVPDQPFLYEQLTVAELLGFIGGMYRMDPARLEAQATALLRLFELEAFVTQRIAHLSYGMKSRLVLTASLLHEPAVLIMDEPFFGLDPKTLRVMKQFLRDRAQQGMTAIVSTHQLAVVEDVADRIAVMVRGRVVALGSLAELTEHVPRVSRRRRSCASTWLRRRSAIS